MLIREGRNRISGTRTGNYVQRSGRASVLEGKPYELEDAFDPEFFRHSRFMELDGTEADAGCRYFAVSLSRPIAISRRLANHLRALARHVGTHAQLQDQLPRLLRAAPPRAELDYPQDVFRFWHRGQIARWASGALGLNGKPEQDKADSDFTDFSVVVSNRNRSIHQNRSSLAMRFKCP